MFDSEKHFLVGIGASAGGLEAIRSLLKAAPTEAPAAYVVLQHMSPTQRSMLPDLIQRETHLEVREISEPVRPQVNFVYVVPPNADAVFVDGEIRLLEASTEPAAPKPSIDRFFRSIAEQVTSRAIGIVLSGTGSDGSVGVKAIRESGGITFAQDDLTAKYDGMPNSAIETGCVDLVLSPVEIAAHFGALSQNEEVTVEKIKTGVDQAPLTEILQIVMARTRVDFRDYKSTTIVRRLERRMTALGISNQVAFVQYCREHPEEADNLKRDFLISVTRFFRDGDEFQKLRPHLDELITKTRHRELRVWVTGCATGEEAYTVAILLVEALGGLKEAEQHGLQIFATDIDESALQTARKGVYPSGAIADIPAPYLDKYFKTTDREIHVLEKLKRFIIFSHHNVAQDPPFQNIDLICCRNVLIYFGSNLQERTFGNFHYSLRGTGILFLGTADNVTFSRDLFRELEAGQKVFSKLNVGQIDYNRRARNFAYASEARVVPVEPNGQDKRLRENTVFHDIESALVKSLGKNAILLTSDLQIAKVYGDVSHYLSLTENTNRIGFNHNLIVEPVASEIRVLAAMTAEKGGPRRGFKQRFERLDGKIVQVEMYYLTRQDWPEDLFLAVFIEDDPKPEDDITDDFASRHEGKLQDELSTARAALQHTIERWETTNEELRASNEEYQSNNEELQSLNEELETANEELQSTNEELVTMNEAFQVKTDELNDVNEELEAVLQQIEPALIVFSANLIMSRTSASGARLFGVDANASRPHLSHLALPEGFPVITTICAEVVQTGASVSQEFVANGQTYQLTCAPFTNGQGEIQGGTLLISESGGRVDADQA